MNKTAIFVTALSVFCLLAVPLLASAEYTQSKFFVENGEEFEWNLSFEEENFPGGVKEVRTFAPNVIELKSKDISPHSLSLSFEVDDAEEGIYIIGVQVVSNNSVKLNGDPAPVRSYVACVGVGVAKRDALERVSSFFGEEINETEANLTSEIEKVIQENNRLEARLDNLSNTAARVNELKKKLDGLESEMKKSKSSNPTGFLISNGGSILGVIILVGLGVYLLYKHYMDSKKESQSFDFSP